MPRTSGMSARGTSSFGGEPAGWRRRRQGPPDRVEFPAVHPAGAVRHGSRSGLALPRGPHRPTGREGTQMDAFFRDLRYGTRLLLKDRRLSIAAILTLATCLAMNIAVFTVVNAVLLRPLSVPRGDRLVLMANQYPGQNTPENP